MRSIRDTQKITNAMYMIASTKMKKAKNELDMTKPYFEAVRREIKRVFRTVETVDSKYLYPEEGSEALNGTYGCLVITADKGLAGSYNQNVLREARRMYDEHPDMRMFVVGEYGRQFCLRHNIPIAQSFLYTAQNPTIDRAMEIGEVLLHQFNDEGLDKIFIIFTDMKNGISAEAVSFRLIPFHHSHFYSTPEEKEMDHPVEFRPSPGVILDNMIESYVTGFIYGALVDSFCSEQNARMMAMSAANENAEKILGELYVQFHRVRQAAITQEITEVCAGARAQKRRKERKEADQEPAAAAKGGSQSRLEIHREVAKP